MDTRFIIAVMSVAAILVGADLSVAQGPEGKPQQLRRGLPQVINPGQADTVVQAPRQLPPGLALQQGKLRVGGGYSVQVQSATTARLNNNDGGSGTLSCEGCCTISWSGGTLSCTKTGDCGCVIKIEIPLPKAIAR